MDVWSVLEGELLRYRASVPIIRQCLSFYANACNALIKQISNCSSFENTGELFDELHGIQRELSIAKYKFEFPLSEELQDLIYYLDRDDVPSRKYWYERFRGGLAWPAE